METAAPRSLARRRFVASRAFDVSAPALFAWHARPGALERLMPPWEHVEVESREGGVADGRVVFRMRGPLGPLRWVAQHGDFVPGREFTDEQVRGPFAHWVHRHVVVPTAPHASRLEDRIEYALPGGRVGEAVGGASVERRLRRLFAFRHRRTAEDLARHAEFASRPRQRIALSGATGFLGTALGAFLQTGGHEVVPLVRDGTRAGIAWDPLAGRLDAAALEGFDAVIHLAGAGLLDRRWSSARRRELWDSRVNGTRLLAAALAERRRPPRVLVSASAVGIHGDRGEEVLDETSPPGVGFLADLGRAWEEATRPAEEAGVRVVHLRLGVVLGARGGALARARPAFRLGLGGVLGEGRAWLPWVALDDVVGVAHRALFEEDWRGPFHVVAPEPVRQDEFARALGRVLHRPAALRMPRGLARLLWGEAAQAVLLASQRAVPARLQACGHPFLRPDLTSTLAFEFGHLPSPETTYETGAWDGGLGTSSGRG